MPAPNFKAIFDAIMDGVIDENKPNVFGGSQKADGAMKGLPITSAGRGVCNYLQWVNDNTPYNVTVLTEWGRNGAMIGWRVYDKNGAIVYEYPMIPFCAAAEDSEPSMRAHEVGRQLISKFIIFANNNIKIP